MLNTYCGVRLFALNFRNVVPTGYGFSKKLPISLIIRPSLCTFSVSRRFFGTEQQKSAEKHEFQAETRMLLDIVAKSLYSEKEVFLRELISNASDSLEKLRLVQLSDSESAFSNEGLEIHINTDADKRTLTIRDTGMGMAKQDLIDCLGTIARSGSKEFVERLVQSGGASDSIIGQFGVGFYSVFMVSDLVKVTTRSYREGAHGYIWESDGNGSYSIRELTNDHPSGSTIELHLKTDEFTDEKRIEDVIRRYSAFVSAPIMLNGKLINSQNAIWTMSKNEVTNEMHDQFYKYFTKSQESPRYTIHYQTDSPLNIRTLLYVPMKSRTPFGLTATNPDINVSLYSRRVMITPMASMLVPNYLRFLTGIVDSEDVPLNLSREMLQKNDIIDKLRRVISNRVVKFLSDQLKKHPDTYRSFHDEYSLFLKEGILMEQNDKTLRKDLAGLLLFESSAFRPGIRTNLEDYLHRMQKDQDKLFFVCAPNRQLAESSPYYDAIKAENREVLFVYEPHDELVFLAVGEFGDKEIVSLEKWVQSGSNKGSKVDSITSSSSTSSSDSTVVGSDKDELLAWVQLMLGNARVTRLTTTTRQSAYPALITVEDMSAARQYIRMGQLDNKAVLTMLKPTFELNLAHPIIVKLLSIKRQDPKLAEMVIEQLYNNSLITAGLITDSREIIGPLNELLTKLIGDKKTSTVITP